jgi:hypothetical protein
VNPRIFITLAAVVAALAIAHIAHAQSRSVTLSWTAPGDDGWIGQAKTYDIRFSRYPINASNFAYATHLNTSLLPGPSGRKETLTIFGLTEGVTYYFAVRTADESTNWSPVSNIAYAAGGVAGVENLIIDPQFSSPRPNPSGNRASFAVTLPRAEWLRVEAFDIAGRKVKTVAFGEYSAGSFDLVWDLRDDSGRPLDAGAYMVRGQLGENVFLRRLTVVH